MRRGAYEVNVYMGFFGLMLTRLTVSTEVRASAGLGCWAGSVLGRLGTGQAWYWAGLVPGRLGTGRGWRCSRCGAGWRCSWGGRMAAGPAEVGRGGAG